MRIVNRKAFLALPAGTIYCKGVKWAFDGICIKDDSLENDWFFLDMAWPAAHDTGAAMDYLETSLADGVSFACEDAIGRDGSFNGDAVFMIFEPADLWQLRGRIDEALEVASRAAVSRT